MPVAKKAPVAPEVELQEDVDSITPPQQEVVVTFGTKEEPFSYTQRPLSFYGKIQLMACLGTAVRSAIDEGVGVSELFSEDALTNIDKSESQQADSFVRSIMTVVEFVPELLYDIYTIALEVPRSQRQYVKEVMQRHEEDGGLSDAQGIQILETFIDQNKEVLLDFFKSKIIPLVGKLAS